MVCALVLTGGAAPATPTAPTGWAVCTGFPITVSVVGFFYKIIFFWRVAKSEPATYLITHASSGKEAIVYAVGDAERKEPKITINGHSNPADGARADAVGLSITTQQRYQSMITFISMGGAPGPVPAVPGGTTPTFVERYNSASTLFSVSDGPVAANVATGNKTQTATNADAVSAWAGFLIEFEPRAMGDGSVASARN